jgi:ABC-type transporter Mla subunit MlaD
VADAGQTMSEIVGSVQRVSDIIGEITAASGEQSDGIGQVNVAVTQLDQMTQQNAALVEESAAAAESLKDQAQRLAQVIEVFRTDDTGLAQAMPSARSGSVKKESASNRGANKAGEPTPSKAAAKPSASSAPAFHPVAQSAALLRPQPVTTSTSPTSAKASNAASTEGEWESF